MIEGLKQFITKRKVQKAKELDIPHLTGRETIANFPQVEGRISNGEEGVVFKSEWLQKTKATKAALKVTESQLAHPVKQTPASRHTEITPDISPWHTALNERVNKKLASGHQAVLSRTLAFEIPTQRAPSAEEKAATESTLEQKVKALKQTVGQPRFALAA